LVIQTNAASNASQAHHPTTEFVMPRHGLFALLALAGLLITTADAALPRSIGDVSHVNKSIQIEDAGRAGELETVNGSIQVGNAASIESADTVNGAIRLGDGSHARALETINGSITLGARAQIENGIETVNGSLNLGDDAEVLGSAENVNGSIVLKPRAHVGGTSRRRAEITCADCAGLSFACKAHKGEHSRTM